MHISKKNRNFALFFEFSGVTRNRGFINFLIMDIKKLVQDNKNFNKGTERGNKMLMKSLQEFGAGRSVLVDKDYRIIGGNKTVNACILAGICDIKVVDSDGSKLVAVKRTDLDLDSREGRGLAVADNAVGKLNLDWDNDAILEVAKEFGINAQDWLVQVPEEIEQHQQAQSVGSEKEKTKTLSLSFTPEEYGFVLNKLRNYGDDFSKSFMLIINSYSNENKFDFRR